MWEKADVLEGIVGIYALLFIAYIIIGGGISYGWTGYFPLSLILQVLTWAILPIALSSVLLIYKKRADPFAILFLIAGILSLIFNMYAMLSLAGTYIFAAIVLILAIILSLISGVGLILEAFDKIKRFGG